MSKIINNISEEDTKAFYASHPELNNSNKSSNHDNSWIQTYSGIKFFPLNPSEDQININDIAHALSMICRFTGHCKEFYCVTPDTKILTSNLIWKKAGDLQLFEGLVGFDENTGEDGLASNNRKSRRKMKYAYVKHVGLIKRHVYALHLSNGTILKCSEEHPWLICSKKSKNQKWETTKEIIEAINNGKQRFLLQFIKPWEDYSNSSFEDNYKLGYLSGIFDGEATINCNRKGFLISISQNPGPVLDKVKQYLDDYRFTYTELTSKKCHTLQINGKWSDKLRFLSLIKSIRLLKKYQDHLEKNEWRKEFDSISMLSIIKVDDLGMQDVVALETSSKTYFAEGFGSHNSVAQHAVLVSYLGDPKYGLLHDCSEAYIADIASPVKNTSEFIFYRNLESKLQSTIYNKFGLFGPEPESVKKADLMMLSIEAKSLLGSLHVEWKLPYQPLPLDIIPLAPKQAESLFLQRFKELFNA